MIVTGRTWTAERVNQLKSHFEAGLSCSQIADEIGVSRNAVIGKINRMRLSRFGAVIAKPRQRRAPPRFSSQHHILAALRAEPLPLRQEAPVENMSRCSLVDLAEEECRWPISDPGARDFGFCGRKAVNGLPYCAAHARMAYQPASGQRARR
jgi:GcrA cell cycle regulator